MPVKFKRDFSIKIDLQLFIDFDNPGKNYKIVLFETCRLINTVFVF